MWAVLPSDVACVEMAVPSDVVEVASLNSDELMSAEESVCCYEWACGPPDGSSWDSHCDVVEIGSDGEVSLLSSNASCEI